MVRPRATLAANATAVTPENSPDLPAALLLSLESSQGTEKPESSEPGRRSPGM